MVDEFYEARRRSIQLGDEGPVRDYFLLPGTCPQRAAALATVLRNNGIEVRRVAKSVKADCTEIRTSEKGRREIPAGSFHVSVAQPAGRLVRVLLDRQVDLKQEFIERQIQRNADRFPDEIYDVTAWSLPLAFGVDCLSTAAAIPVASELWDGAPQAGQVVGGRAKVAYLIPGHDAALPALLSWLRKGLRVHVADRDFRMGDDDCPRGTLILRTSENPDTLHDTMKQAARDHGLRILASNTGLVSDGRSAGWAACPMGAAAQGRAAGGSPRQLCRRAYLVLVRPGLALSDHAGRRQQFEPLGAARVQRAGAARRRLQRPRGARRERRRPLAAMDQRRRHADSDQACGLVGHAEAGRVAERPGEEQARGRRRLARNRRPTSRLPTRLPSRPRSPPIRRPASF